MEIKVITIKFDTPKWVKKIFKASLPVLFVVFSTVFLFADTVTLTEFQAGQVAKASEVNANFTALADAINKCKRNYAFDSLDETFTVPNNTAWQDIPGLKAVLTTTDLSDLFINISLEVRDDFHGVMIGIFHNGNEISGHYNYFASNDFEGSKSIVKVIENVNVGEQTIEIKAKKKGSCCGEHSKIYGDNESRSSFLFVEELKK